MVTMMQGHYGGKRRSTHTQLTLPHMYTPSTESKSLSKLDFKVTCTCAQVHRAVHFTLTKEPPQHFDTRERERER